MTVKEQQRRNVVVLRIRELRNKCGQQGNNNLSYLDEVELTELQIEANKNNWFYW